MVGSGRTNGNGAAVNSISERDLAVFLTAHTEALEHPCPSFALASELDTYIDRRGAQVCSHVLNCLVHDLLVAFFAP